MSPEIRNLIMGLFDQHRIMTIATNRPDGWPQATTVGYVNEGLTLYCYVARLSQKYANIRRDSRVSIAIAGNSSNLLQVQGISMAGKAALVEDRREFSRITDMFLQRCPEYAAWGRPNPALSPLLRITPEIISVLDYSKGFGHSELVTVSRKDFHPAAPQASHSPALG